MSTSITLAALVGGHVPVEWYEAVALVREVADRLLAYPTQPVVIPELDQIHLSPEGHVQVTGGIRCDEPVRRLGQLLQALLTESDVPLQLRLVISQATAPAPVYASILEYSEALSFFERPERSTTLNVLAARATAAGAPDPDRALTLDSIAPLPSTQPSPEPPQPNGSSPSATSMVRAALAAMLVVLVVGGAALFVWRRGLVGPGSNSDVSGMANRASNKVGTALLSGASAVTETLGLGRIVPANQADPPAPPPPAVEVPKPAPSANRPRPEPAPTPPPFVAFDLDPEPVVTPTAEAPPEPARSNGAASEPRLPDLNVYSIDSEGITPPIGMRPQLARRLPPDLDLSHLGRVELIIAADGSVESAKLVTPPRSVNDGLFLSVAKAWSFQPALKDGFPVKYRKIIWIARP